MVHGNKWSLAIELCEKYHKSRKEEKNIVRLQQGVKVLKTVGAGGWVESRGALIKHALLAFTEENKIE